MYSCYSCQVEKKIVLIYLCSIVMINQIFYVVKDALDASKFKLPAEIVLQPDASPQHQPMKNL